MAFTLENFKIINLYGFRTINIEFADNKLILVGENGTGKTTVANLIYYFLTRQWDRMADYNFDSVELTIGQDHSKRTETYVVEKPDVVAFNETAMQERIQFDYDTKTRWYTRHGQALRTIKLHSTSNLDDVVNRTKKLDDLGENLSKAITPQIVSLPTYRRIEKELEDILHDPYKEELRQILRRRGPTDRKEKHYMELVEFGMQDVEDTMKLEMSRLTKTNRINDLSGLFLNDVIQQAFQDLDASDLFSLSEKETDEVLRRVRDQLFSEADKKKLKNTIERLKDRKDIKDTDKVTLQVLVRLLELHKFQNVNESSFVEFVKICNMYLRDKDLSFDNTDFSYEIRTKDPDNPKKIELSMLSSGEKQIVSLFSHMYLSEKQRFLVMIDEPELSLSVPWQRKFLPDIMNTGKCDGLIAVTHSPFVYQNELKPFARDIKEFWV